MRRVIGMDIHRTFGEVVLWEEASFATVGVSSGGRHWKASGRASWRRTRW